MGNGHQDRIKGRIPVGSAVSVARPTIQGEFQSLVEKDPSVDKEDKSREEVKQGSSAHLHPIVKDIDIHMGSMKKGVSTTEQDVTGKEISDQLGAPNRWGCHPIAHEDLEGHDDDHGDHPQADEFSRPLVQRVNEVQERKEHGPLPPQKRGRDSPSFPVFHGSQVRRIS